jgi:hypothetical protein
MFLNRKQIISFIVCSCLKNEEPIKSHLMRHSVYGGSWVYRAFTKVIIINGHRSTFTIPAAKVLPLMDQKLDRCKGKNNRGE